MSAALLRANGICVPDWPRPFRYAHPHHDEQARIFLPFIETLMPDTEAWGALFSDEQHLACFKVVHGNRKGKRRPSNGQGRLDGIGKVTEGGGDGR